MPDINPLSYHPADPLAIRLSEEWGGVEFIVAGIDWDTTLTDLVTMPCQTHTAHVECLTSERLRQIREDGIPAATIFPDTDALITDLSGEWIGGRTADCVPILLYAPDIRAVAAIHAGWKGTLHGIAAETVDRLCASGAETRNMRAYIGPCICGDCYEVSPELAEAFAEGGMAHGVLWPEEGGRPHLDLAACNRRLLLQRGLLQDAVTIGGVCTRHAEAGESAGATAQHPLYSYRRNPGETGRNITAIRLLP
ncbi:MAG: polyphenol oxidase family protein [Muribaculaceae bacterium]|nr:polyphenol oxidase family protein [Muribaculaceae bacterium]